MLRGRERRQAINRKGGDGNTFQEMHSRLIYKHREKSMKPREQIDWILQRD